VRRLTVKIGPIGALVDVEIGITDLRRLAHIRAKIKPPTPVRVTMLVDTGASHTFIDETALASLLLTPRDTVEYHSASTRGSPDRCNVYDVDLRLGSMAEQNVISFDPLEIMATPFVDHRHQGLLGRDVLSRVQLVWNGPTARVELLYV
jgi:predicted aspartyl protease